MKKRYGVVLTYDNRRDNSMLGYAGRFRRFNQAVKERDRRNQASPHTVHTHADLLNQGSFKSRWRVWDHGRRTFAD